MFQNITQSVKNKLFFLMIPDGEVLWHYIARKKLSALSIGRTSKCDGDFYFLNCLHLFRTKRNLITLKSR